MFSVLHFVCVYIYIYIYIYIFTHTLVVAFVCLDGVTKRMGYWSVDVFGFAFCMCVYIYIYIYICG